MRILVVATFVSGVAFAQTPAVRPYFWQSDAGVSPPSTAWKWLRTTPNSTAVPAPAQTCAIPLLNMMPGSGSQVDPKILIPAPQSAPIDHMPVIQGLPVCKQDKK
jgi:hypothetical protein